MSKVVVTIIILKTQKFGALLELDGGKARIMVPCIHESQKSLMEGVAAGIAKMQGNFGDIEVSINRQIAHM